MSGIVGGGGSKSGVIGEIGLGVSHLTHFSLTTNDTVVDGKITNWNDPSTPLSNSGSIGELVSESAGVFTLPTGGIWMIQAVFQTNHTAGDNWVIAQLWKSNGTPVILAESFGGLTLTGGSTTHAQQGNSCALNYIVKEQGNTFEFRTSSISNSGSYMYGAASWTVGAQESYVTFMKLGNSSST